MELEISVEIQTLLAVSLPAFSEKLDNVAFTSKKNNN